MHVISDQFRDFPARLYQCVLRMPLATCLLLGMHEMAKKEEHDDPSKSQISQAAAVGTSHAEYSMRHQLKGTVDFCVDFLSATSARNRGVQARAVLDEVRDHNHA